MKRTTLIALLSLLALTACGGATAASPAAPAKPGPTGAAPARATPAKAAPAPASTVTAGQLYGLWDGSLDASAGAPGKWRAGAGTMLRFHSDGRFVQYTFSGAIGLWLAEGKWRVTDGALYLDTRKLYGRGASKRKVGESAAGKLSRPDDIHVRADFGGEKLEIKKARRKDERWFDTKVKKLRRTTPTAESS